MAAGFVMINDEDVNALSEQQDNEKIIQINFMLAWYE